MRSIKLIIVHQHFFKNWDKDWAYIGRNFSAMQNWEKQIGSGKRILITNLFRHFFEKDKIDFLRWSDAQRDYNNDSLSWWMTHLGGRNNMSSFIFESICQIKALKSVLNNRQNNCNEILIVCENVYICKSILENFKNNYNVKLTISYYKGFLYNWSKYLLLIPYGLIRTFFKLFTSYSNALLTKKFITPEKLGKKNIFLIHQCLDTKSFMLEKKLTDRYFTILPDWLEKNGNSVIRLPWLYNVEISKYKIFKRLRKDNCLVIEDYLNLFDYLNAFRNYIKSIFSISYCVKYTDFNIKSLLIRENLIQATASNIIRFWLYGPALSKWSKELGKITVIDTFEMMAAEHSQVSFLRKLSNKVTFIGYYHSLVSKDFLAYWNLNMKFGSSILPDYIITNGKMGKKILVEQGFEENKILVGPALRQNFTSKVFLKNEKNLILICPLDLDSALEAILKLKTVMENITNLNINIQVKAHPMIPKLEILKKLTDNKLPFDWEWNDMDIADAIDDKYCCVVLASASVFDAILSDCIVINMQRELSAMGNFGDILQEKYPLLKEVPDIDLSNRIVDIFSANSNYYKTEFIKIKSELLEGLNPVNDSTLNVFLKKL